MTAAAPGALPRPLTLLGRPLPHWLFGLRTWASMVLALYAAFWLQLDNASSAAVTAAILALPTRGQAYTKALHRLAGTAIGVVAAIVIAGLFNEVRTLFLFAVAAWLALCVFAASMLDGNRAYAAVLSGYTVALVAVAAIDAPGRVFSSGMDSGAAIAVGIAAVALVNDLSGTPGVLSSLTGRVAAAHREVRAFAIRASDGVSANAVATARLFGLVAALRADALLLPVEAVSGRARAAAARRAVAELVSEARAARVLGSTLASMEEHGADWRERLAAALADPAAAEGLLARCAQVFEHEGADAPLLVAARSVEAVVRRDRLAAAAIGDMRTGSGASRGPRLPLYRSRRGAARNAMRTFLCVLAAGALLVLSGLPASSTALVFVCVLAGLSANTPDPWKFIAGALLAIPLATAAAGVTEFVVLDGADAYPLLALALLPTVLAGCLLMSAGRPALFGIGFLLIVFTPALMLLANPQSYDPVNYLNEALFIAVAALLLAVAVRTLLPTDDTRRRGWMLGSCRRELFAAVEGRGLGGLTVEEASFRAADRLGQLAALSYRDEAERAAALSHALRLTEVAFSARRLRAALEDDAGHTAAEARAALRALDGARLRAAGKRLRASPRARWAAANAARTAALIDRYGDDLALARAGEHP